METAECLDDFETRNKFEIQRIIFEIQIFTVKFNLMSLIRALKPVTTPVGWQWLLHLTILSVRNRCIIEHFVGVLVY